MKLDDFIETMQPAIESRLQEIVNRLDRPHISNFKEMITYHMGWTGKGAGPAAQGKRIRPLLLLLSCSAAGSEWINALPAAAAIEYIHNFSLVHDDIQDQSELRRGRETVWKKWGIAHAINVGDLLFILAHIALNDLDNNFSLDLVEKTTQCVNEACLELSCGQYLDMSYEKYKTLSLEDYWPMVSGKTAALLAACTQIGSTLGGADDSAQIAYRDFGHYLGLAFQAEDDYLGIWGDAALTGKSTDSDLVTGKKSLPILFALNKNGEFSRRWITGGSVRPEEVVDLADLLSQDGAKLYTLEIADQMTDMALQALRTANPQNDAGQALFELPRRLLNREA